MSQTETISLVQCMPSGVCLFLSYFVLFSEARRAVISSEGNAWAAVELERRCRGPDEPSSAASAGLGAVQEAGIYSCPTNTVTDSQKSIQRTGGTGKKEADPNQNVRKEMGPENTRNVALNNELDPDGQAVTLQLPIMTASGDQTGDLIP